MPTKYRTKNERILILRLEQQISHYKGRITMVYYNVFKILDTDLMAPINDPTFNQHGK